MRSYSLKGNGRRRRSPLYTWLPFLVGLSVGILLSMGLRYLFRQQQSSCKRLVGPQEMEKFNGQSSTTTDKMMDIIPNNLYFHGQIDSLDELANGQAVQLMMNEPPPSPMPVTTDRSKNQDIRPTKLLVVGVMTAQKYLDSRAVGVFQTWAQDVPGHVIFFVGGGSQITNHKKQVLANNFTIVSLAGVDDYSYPPQKKSFFMLKYMYDNYGDVYEWFMRADDDVYIKADKLAEFLRSINSRHLYFIGQAGKGNQEEKGTLNLAHNENFCMGGPGIILSRAAMIKVAPNVHDCLQDMYSTHEDVELGRCVHRFAGISCTWAYEMQSIFYHNSSGDEAFTYNLKQREVHRAITLHPVKDYRHMYRLHSYIQELKIQELLYQYILVQRDLLALASKNLTNFEDFYYDTSHGVDINSTLISKNIFQHVNVYGVQPSLNKYQPRSLKDIIPWNFLGKGIFSSDPSNPKQKITDSFKESLEDVVSDVMDVINGFSRVRGRVIDFNKILWGYYRLNPLYGEDYILDLHMTYKKYRGRKMTVPVRRHLYIQRPFAPLELQVINPPPSNNKKDNDDSLNGKKKNSKRFVMILPLAGRNEAFERFLQSYQESCATWDRATESTTELQLNIVYFPLVNNNANKSEKIDSDNQFFSLIRRFRKQTLVSSAMSCPIKIVQVDGEFSRSIALEMGISKCADNDLLFLIDVDIKFSPEALQRVILNTVQGSQVYFPIVFSQFNPNLYNEVYSLDGKGNDIKNQVISTETGYWRDYGFGIAAFFKSDFRRVGGFDTSIRGWGKEDVSLYEQFISQTNLTLFRAPDPHLVHIYHDINCDDNLSPAQYEMCLGTRANTLGSVKTLMKYIFKHRPGNSLKRFLQASATAA